jgi:hypothetical protein
MTAKINRIRPHTALSAKSTLEAIGEQLSQPAAPTKITTIASTILAMRAR